MEKKKKIFGIRQRVEHPKQIRQFLSELIAEPPKTPKQLEQRKYEFSKREKIPTVLNRDLLAVAENQTLPVQLANLLQKRAVRTISGVSPIGILTKPYPCPGRCVYCPTEARMPKSYLSNQPAAARAVRNKFHPYAQVQNRITALKESGHPVSKLEVIVMGGTWSFLPHRYQSWYVKNIFNAANEMSGLKKGKTLEEAQKINETAEHRVIGLTLETRPDFINEAELVRMRRYGCTRIEIGVQTLDDEVSRLTKRGHKTSHVKRAMKLMKDFGFKVCWHLMPGLPGSTPEKDLSWMQEVFSDPDCRPDFIKIYPCVVLDTAELYTWWKEGKYSPMEDKALLRLLLQWKKSVPPWVRIMRLMRDIPADSIAAGAKFSNLRQILKSQPEKLKELVGSSFYTEYCQGKGWPCQCIRCRELGFQMLDNRKLKDPETSSGNQNNQGDKNMILKRRDYEASGGMEVFLSFESADESKLYALLRLRKPGGQKFSHFRSVLENAALIREVHSYGGEVSVGEGAGMGQHRGLGRQLLAEAERIAREEWGIKKITIIAGVGTREYYRKFGYKLRSTYMTKPLS